MAASKKSPKLQLPATVFDGPRAKLVAAQANRARALELMKIAEQIFDGLAEADVKARGICPRCHGRGVVVTWDTMDSLSGCYAEFGKCPNPTCSADVTGPSLVRAHYTKYDSNRGVPHPDMSDLFQRICAGPKRVVAETVRAVEAIESDMKELRRLRRGDPVVVTAGKSYGTVGPVFWTDTNPRDRDAFPSRVGIDTGVPDPAKPGRNVAVFVDVDKCEKLV